MLLRREEGVLHRPPGWPCPRLWIEVPDARAMGERLAAAGIPPLEEPFSVATGWTVEVADPWGNVVGFTDYTKRPELGRRRAAPSTRSPSSGTPGRSTGAPPPGSSSWER
ncbi:hypothetical protein GCM10020256_28240 [Streptomyces thermocoprophilus]